MKLKLLLAFALLAGGTMFAGGRFFVGIGAPVPYAYSPYAYRVAYAPPPPPAYYARPAYPGPGYSWVDGHHYWGGAAYAWRPGYYVRPPYVGPRWNGPRYYGGRYYHGYWRR
jgi:hypothetical protein